MWSPELANFVENLFRQHEGTLEEALGQAQLYFEFSADSLASFLALMLAQACASPPDSAGNFSERLLWRLILIVVGQRLIFALRAKLRKRCP